VLRERCRRESRWTERLRVRLARTGSYHYRKTNAVIDKERAMKPLTVLSIVVLAAGLSAQETPTTLPPNYAVQFDNAWVKVTSVRYGPLEKVAPHAHTPNPSAYVYLNDGPPVKFRHIGGKGVVATRPATRAGAFRVYRGLEEIHEVENTGETPSEFLRVELKTQGINPDRFWGKFERPPTASTDPVVQFDHPQAKISRVWARPGEKVTIAASSEPALVIALGAGAGFTAGQARWVPASSETTIQNTSAEAIDFLRFDFRTSPVGTAR
jgi:hypothetical protein